jgi:hypothetical protein
MPSTVGIVASSVFTPLDLNPALWLDAADLTTITASGSPLLVSQWNDKSGNGRNFTQGSSTNQPRSQTVTQNGFNVLEFLGNQSLVGPTTPELNAPPVEVFVAGDVTTTGTWFSQVNTATGGNRQFQMFRDLIRSVGAFVRGNPTDLLRNPQTDRFRVAAINWTTTSRVLRDGNQVVALNVGAATETDVPWRVGARGPGVSFPLNGTVGEVLLFLRNLTTAERTQVLEYLAAKWSITL